MHLLHFEFDMRSMEMKGDTQNEQQQNIYFCMHRAVLAHERIAGMIMPIALHVHCIVRNSKENTQTKAATFQKYSFNHVLKKQRCGKLNAQKKNNQTIHDSGKYKKKIDSSLNLLIYNI